MAELAAILHRHQRIGIDTAVFIYHLEGALRYADVASEVLRELMQGSFAGITSVITVMELTVKPLQLGRQDIADEYDVLLSHLPHLTIVELDVQVARRAASRATPLTGLPLAWYPRRRRSSPISRRVPWC